MLQAQMLFSNIPGPLPVVSQTYTPVPSQLYISSGSLFAASPALCGYTSGLASTQTGTNKIWVNQPNTHLTCPDQYTVVPGTDKPSVALSLDPSGPAKADVNDRFNAVMLQDPSGAASLQPVVAMQSALPITNSFNVGQAGYKLLLASGSVWSRAINSPVVGFSVVIDGNTVAQCQGCINPANVHSTMVSQYAVVYLGAGQHQMELLPLSTATTTDANDFFSVSLIDLDGQSSAIPVINRSGPFPLTYTFNNPNAANKLFLVSGSVFAAAANTICGLNVILDQGTPTELAIGATQLWLNQQYQHTTLPTLMVKTSAPLAAGAHTITVQATGPGVNSDANDWCSVLMLDVI